MKKEVDKDRVLPANLVRLSASLNQLRHVVTQIALDSKLMKDTATQNLAEAKEYAQHHYLASDEELHVAHIKPNGFIIFAESLEPLAEKKAPAPKIARVYGFTFARVVGSCLPRRLREAVESQHADSHAYYLEMVAAKDEWGARRVAAMMYFWILASVFSSAVPLMLGMFKGTAGASKE